MAETISGNFGRQEAHRFPGVEQAPLARTRRHFRLRKKVTGSAERPRLVVNRCSRHIVVQLVDDLAGHTLASASTLEADVAGARRRQEGPARPRSASWSAARAREAGVTAVVFDRGGDGYHGRIAALADAAREGGLEF